MAVPAFPVVGNSWGRARLPNQSVLVVHMAVW
jgi:hypothetical protein